MNNWFINVDVDVVDVGSLGKERGTLKRSFLPKHPTSTATNQYHLHSFFPDGCLPVLTVLRVSHQERRSVSVTGRCGGVRALNTKHRFILDLVVIILEMFKRTRTLTFLSLNTLYVIEGIYWCRSVRAPTNTNHLLTDSVSGPYFCM